VKITGIHHKSVVVTDLDRARGFYRDVLGLEEVPTPPAFGEGIAWFQIGDQQIHLLRGSKADAPTQRHIALHVDKGQAARRELSERGYLVEEATPIPGADRFFTADPDGNRIEIMQWSSTWPEQIRQLGLNLRSRA